jgi:prepilin-type N-terminal cleavage/methylation domain-containing protein
MRQLKTQRGVTSIEPQRGVPSIEPQRGVTLIELMVTILLLSVLLMLGLPALADHVRQARVRAGAQSVVATLLFARNEAIKRNERLTLSIEPQTLTVRDSSGSALRAAHLPDGVALAATSTLDDDSATAIDFNAAGRTHPFGSAYRIDTVLANMPCSDELRCPRVMVRSGGAVRLCSGQEDC